MIDLKMPDYLYHLSGVIEENIGEYIKVKSEEDGYTKWIQVDDNSIGPY